MAVSVNYEIGESLEYADTPVIYRVVTVDDVQVSKEFATFDEVAASQPLEDEYLAALREYFLNTANELFSVGSLSEIDSSRLFGLNNCTTYILQNLAGLSRPTPPLEG